jgi:hypothetical protein
MKRVNTYVSTSSPPRSTTTDLPNATLRAGAWPVLNKAGTAQIPHIPNRDAVILYRLIVSEKGPMKINDQGQGRS